MRKMIVLIIGLPLAFPCIAQTGDPAAGKLVAGNCIACHGADGISTNPLWPNLAGQKRSYLSKQLRAFKTGSRSDPFMSPMARRLSDDDIDNLSAYFGNLKPRP